MLRGWRFQKQNRKEEEGKTEQHTYQFTQGFNILHRLQVHHLTQFLSYTISYQLYVYIHTYIYILIIIRFLLNDTISIRYKSLIKKNERSRFLSVVGAYIVGTSSLNDKLLSN